MRKHPLPLHVLSALAAGILGACGTTEPIPAPTPGDTTPPVTQQPEPDKADAGAVTMTEMDASKPPPPPPPPPPPGSDVYPAAHYPIPTMKNYGGPVLSDMKIVTVTYVGNAQRDALRTYNDAVLSTPWWAAVSRGFGINPGTGGLYAELEDTVSGKTLENDTDLKPMIKELVTAGKLPTPTANTLYAFYFPQSTTITLGSDASCQSFGGYHDSATVELAGGAKVEAAFAVMPNCGGGVYEVATHEFIEAATDPHPMLDNTYYLWNDAWAGPLGGESADLCQGRGGSDALSKGAAKSWVNQAALESKDPCQPSDDGKLYFGAAVETESVMIVDDSDHTNDHVSDGYLRVKAGQTRDVNVVVFSEAKLPGELELVVGKRTQSDDPRDVDPIFKGVDATLSQKKGTNGSKVTLNIKVAAGTKTGDHLFVVRAVLADDDYHSWPVILRIE